MRSLLMLSNFISIVFISTSSIAFSAEVNFVGTFVQKHKLMTPASNWGDCDSKKEFDSETSTCITPVENSLEIKPSPGTGASSVADVGIGAVVTGRESSVATFNVKIVNHGANKSTCELDLKMKVHGEKMILAQKLKGASKDYSLFLKKTKSGIQIIEKLGNDEVASGSSPGCGVGSFVSGNGGEYVQQYANHLTQGIE